jgi:hypothetical protein
MFTVSSGAIPSICKPSLGQAAYHFLARYHDGKSVPAYNKAPSPGDPLALASSLFSHVGGPILCFSLSGYLVTPVSHYLMRSLLSFWSWN